MDRCVVDVLRFIGQLMQLMQKIQIPLDQLTIYGKMQCQFCIDDGTKWSIVSRNSMKRVEM